MSPAIDVAAAIIIRDDRVLVARRGEGRAMAGLWEFPGGKIEPGETPQHCIVRELAEELAIDCVAGDVVIAHRHHDGTRTINLIAVRVFTDESDFSLVDHDRLDWVGADALLALDLAPADIPIARYVRDLL